MYHHLRNALVAAFVIVALGFGAFQLRAGASDPCGGTHGPCSNQGECETLCMQLFPENGGVGICFETHGCCMCAER